MTSNHSITPSILDFNSFEAGASSQRCVLPRNPQSQRLNIAVFHQYLHPNLQILRALPAPSTLPQLEAGPDAPNATRTSRP